jgi:hypothetical protein
MKSPNQLLVFSFLFFTYVLQAQTTLTTNKSEQHIAIKGTQVFLKPPTGYESATNFLGFQNAAIGASIMVIQLSGPYNEVISGFSPSNMKQRGMSLLEKENVSLNNYRGTLFTVRQFSPAHGFDFLKYTLILNVGKNSTLMINGSYPESVKETAAQPLKSAILSAYYDATLKTDNLSSLDFTVDISTTKFKLSDKSLSGSLILEGPEKEFMMIAKSIRALSTSDKKGSSIAALKAVRNIEYLNFEGGREINQDDAEGYQITALIRHEGKPAKALQTILFGENYYYVFFLIMQSNKQELVNDFENIVRSFKRK